MYKTEEITVDPSYIIRDYSTSDGSQIKYNHNDHWYKIDNYGGEADAECLSTILLDCSNLSAEQYVRYNKIIINGEQGCYCEDFRKDTSNDEFITFYRLFKNIRGYDLASITSKMDYDDAIQYVINFIDEVTGLDIRTYLANIFYLDEIILNTDRHFNNYGIIMSNNSYSLAPIFDNGKSLLVGSKIDLNTVSIDEAIKKAYSKSFSPYFGLNSHYLKEYRTISINKEKLNNLLAEYPDSIQKKVLIHQLESGII